MAKLNENYLKLKAGYLFPEIARRVRTFSQENPELAKRIIRCGIGDVTEPLPAAAREAMCRAIDELGARETFHGYGPEQGYDFLRSAIAQHEYRSRGAEIEDDEIFISDGSKCDVANILDIFGHDNRIAIPDPVYPVYVDTNVMAGHTGSADSSGNYAGLIYLPCARENHFMPDLPQESADLIYLCSPNNPTGAVATREQLQQWVNYANEHRAVILYDTAYSDYICDPDIPRSIYEIEGAQSCAIEFKSFSKSGGFTGVRCACAVVPKKLTGQTAEGTSQALHPLWHRRAATKFNGVGYPVQRGAAALYTKDGRAQVQSLIEHYMGNAKILREAAQKVGLEVFGGENAPYLWVSNPSGLTSWEVFDLFLTKAQVIITPGSGFGQCGEGYFRISAFNSRENAVEAAKRLKLIMIS